MNQSERRNYLIRELLNENKGYQKMQVPGSESEQKQLLRSLMNVRWPAPISEEFAAIQDEAWYEAEKRFGDFLTEALSSEKKICLLELGVGFNTPTIIRFPFENLVRKYDQISLVRLNLDEAAVPESLGDRTVGINADMKRSIEDLADYISD